MDCSRPRAMPEGGASFLCRHGGSQTWRSSTGIPPNRPGRRSNGCAKPPLRLCERSRGDRTRSPSLLLTAKAKEDSPGNQCAGGHTAGSRPKRFEFCSRRHFARPFNATRSGSASATEEGFARAAEYPGSRESRFGARRRDRLQDQYVSVWHRSCSHLCRQGLSLFEVENVLSAGRLNHDQCL